MCVDHARIVERDEYGRGELPAALCVGRVLGVPQERLADVNVQAQGRVGWEQQRRLQQRGPFVRDRRGVCRIRDQMIWKACVN